MANDDLNFNLDEFLASHSQGTKHMHSPKKKRTSQSPTRNAAAQKVAERRKQAQSSADSADEKIAQAEIFLPEKENSQSVEPPKSDAATQESLKIEEEISPKHQTQEIFIAPTALQNDENNRFDETDDGENFDSSIDLTPDFSENIEVAESFDEKLQADVADNAEIEESDIAEDTDNIENVEYITGTEDIDNIADKADESKNESENGKAPENAELFGEDIKPDNPDSEPKKPETPSEEIPKYKERTSEISFATKRRLTDTASVGVRRLSESEKPNAKVYTKTSDGEVKSDEEKRLWLEEQLRRDRELTEKILRKAYEQEKDRIELGKEPQSADTSEKNDKSPQESSEWQKRNKRSKSKKNTKKKQEVGEGHSLPVVQVGTGNEDNSQSIIDVLENALDEDVIELEYVSKTNDESHSYDDSPKKKKNKAQTIYFFIGLFFTLMSIIGIVVTAKSLVSFVANVSDDSKQKQEFAEYIYPVVIADPAAFESVSDLSDEAIIKAAIWDIIIYDDVSKYTRDGSNNMYVPYIQVENHAKSLFGTTNIVHTTVAFSQELTFFYDSENRTYKVPVSPQLFPNTPVVREIDKVGERYTLTVDYQEPTPNWELMNSDYTPGIKKTMKYVLTKYNDGYTIISINNAD